MAALKRTRSHKKRSRLLRFPEVRGKIVAQVEVDPDATAISILFQDKTILSFDIDSSHVVFPELSDFKTGNWRGIKRWPRIQGSIEMIKWP